MPASFFFQTPMVGSLIKVCFELQIVNYIRICLQVIFDTEVAIGSLSISMLVFCLQEGEGEDEEGEDDGEGEEGDQTKN